MTNECFCCPLHGGDASVENRGTTRIDPMEGPTTLEAGILNDLIAASSREAHTPARGCSGPPERLGALGIGGGLLTFPHDHNRHEDQKYEREEEGWHRAKKPPDRAEDDRESQSIERR